METKLLSYVVEEFLYDVGLNENKNARKTLRYFLNRNINILFGKEIFSSFELKIRRGVQKEENYTGSQFEFRRSNYLKIIYAENTFILVFNKQDGILKLSKLNEMDEFVIRFDQDKICNKITYSSSEEIVTEYQNVGIEKEAYFDYQKVRYRNDKEEIITIPYRLRPIFIKQSVSSLFTVEELCASKNKSSSSFSISLKESIKNFFSFSNQKDIVQIPSQDNSIDCYDNLLEIYAILIKEEDSKKLERKI